jgi:uncharacterized Zn finger protein (UPF0148 family)
VIPRSAISLNRDEQIQEMSKLLLSGATLLNDSCPDCHVPLFRKGETVFCSSCGRKAVYGKLEHLLTRLSQEEDLNAMEELFKVIAILLDLLQSLKGLGRKDK